MTKRKVYQAICAITAAISRTGVPKGHLNVRDQYFYRSTDDVVNCLSPLLAQHKLVLLPRVLERTVAKWTGEQDQRLLSVTVKMAFDFVSVEDGSSHTVEAYGEALDPSDKATAKAMTAAYKSAVVQAFCIPTAGEDADAASPRLRVPRHDPQPVEGWEQWSKDIIATISICESREALERVQVTHRNQLKAIGSERRALYETIGQAFSRRTRELERPKQPSPALAGRKRSPPKQRKSAKLVRVQPDKVLVDA